MPPGNTYDYCIIDALGAPHMNLSGCDFNKIIFSRECSDLEITVNDDEVDKFYQKYKALSAGVFASININGKSWEELKKKKEEKRKRREKEERKRREEEERKRREEEKRKRREEKERKRREEKERKKKEVEERLKREKEEEERKKMKILKYAGIFGLIYIAFVTPIIVFKDKIKSLFSSKKIVKTPACKVKTSAV